MNRFRTWLMQPVDALPLKVFRSLFGIAMMMEMIYLLGNEVADKLILLPEVRITYDFFEWLSPLPAPLMRMLPALMLIAAFLLAIGKWTRAAGISFFLMHFYFLLLDKGYYNNHMYLYSLLGLLFALAEETKRKDGTATVPNWVWRIIQFQIAVVYFYGGIAKINPDWMFRHEPVISILKAPQTAWILESEMLAPVITNLLVWGGLLYDLGIPFLLLIRKTRWAALILCLIFHLSNIFIFNTGESGTIGEFPLVMIASCILFFEADVIRKWLGKLPVNLFQVKEQRVRKKIPEKQQAVIQSVSFINNYNFVLSFIFIYCLIQLLLPLRHYLITDNVLWTGEANNFAWRMKIRSADFKNTMWVRNEPGGPRTELHPIGFINVMQHTLISQSPVDMMKFAKAMVPILKKRGIANPVIEVTMELGINGRPRQLAIDSTLNLAAVPYVPWKHAEWILPQQNK